MMTAYKNDKNIELAIPKQANVIFDLDYSFGAEVDCVVYNDFDEANAVLSKIHQDVNGGIGRKQWGHQAKQNDNAEKGNRSKTFSIIEFVRQHPNAEKELIEKMNSTKWTSKLERVVGFSTFKDVYGITFDKTNQIQYLDDYDHVYTMLSRLIYDLIEKPATGNTRLKKEFERYSSELPPEFKTKVVEKPQENSGKQETPNENDKGNKDNATDRKEDVDSGFTETAGNESDNTESKNKDEGDAGDEETTENDKDRDNDKEETLPPPKKRDSKAKKGPIALRLTRDYSAKERMCLTEKGVDILEELESLDVNLYPYASASLCRALLEFTLNLWRGYYQEEPIYNSLLDLHGKVITKLQNENIISGKQHSMLSVVANKERFFDSLNGWMHSDSLQCVRVETLINGWTACKIIVELYIQVNSKKD